MFRLIVGRELREILKSAKLAWTFVVASALILVTFYLGARSFVDEQARHEAAVAENLRQMEGLTTWVEAMPVISLPPDPVACLVQGVSNDIGRNVEVVGRGPLRAGGSRYGEEPLLATFRLLDLEFVFGVVLSLFAVVFAFDAVSGEKERGTLRQVFSNPVPRATFIVGKMAGTFLGLVLPLLIPLLLGCLLLVFMGVPMTADAWARLALVVLVGLVYVGAFVGLAVWVSALTRRAATSMLVLLVVWVLAVLVVPRAALLAASRAVDVPSLDEILSQRSRLRAQLWGEDQHEMDAFWQSPEHHGPSADGDTHVFIGQFNQLMQKLSAERQAKLEELERELMEERRNRQAVQRRLGLGLARLSPSAAFTLAATSVSGTSIALVDHFDDEARAFQKTFESFQRDKTGGQVSGEIMVVVRAVREGEEPEAIDPHELPPFSYTHPGVGEGLRRALGDLGLLAVFNVLFFTGGFVAFLRYDVR